MKAGVRAARAPVRIQFLPQPQTIDRDDELLYDAGTASGILDGEAGAAKVYRDGVGDSGKTRLVPSQKQCDCIMLLLFHIQMIQHTALYVSSLHGQQHVHQQQSRYQVQIHQQLYQCNGIDIHKNKQARWWQLQHKPSSKKRKKKSNKHDKGRQDAMRIVGEYKRNMKIASQESKIKNFHNGYKKHLSMVTQQQLFVCVCGIE